MISEIKRINRCLVFGWLLIGSVLLVNYVWEVMIGGLAAAYLYGFVAITIVPFFLVLITYLRNPENPLLRYFFVGGYFVMYGFVMLTGSTVMVFVYILPMLSLLVLYHDPYLVLASGMLAVLFNLIVLLLWSQNGMMQEAKVHKIQLSLIGLCFLGSWLAARIYDGIYRKNEENNATIRGQAEELDRINGQLGDYAEELEEKNEQLHVMATQTMQTIANSIDAKDEYTVGHSWRVAEYSVAIARELGHTDEEELREIRLAGLLHDIGNIGVPDSVLNKARPLTEAEFRLIKAHTTIGGEILKDIMLSEGMDAGAKYHHERYDGSGYPEGLKGEEIPEIARIIAVAEAYDAMLSNRVYRRHLSPERALEELRGGLRTQFDPNAGKAMISLIVEKRLPDVSMEESEEVSRAARILSRIIGKAEEVAVEDMQIDELTGTFCRSQGKSVIQEHIGEHGAGSLHIVDLDGFRRLNETEGVAMGDLYLKTIADLILGLSEIVYVARFGADEFVFYTPGIETAEDAEKLAGHLIASIREKAASDESFGKLSACIGSTLVVSEKDKVMSVYENASRALYVAKQCGKGCYYCHRPEDDEENGKAAESVDLRQLVSILRDREKPRGGMNVAYPQFSKVYDFISNLAERNKQKVRIILFTVHEADGVTLTGEDRDVVMGMLETAIRDSIRNVDASTRYSTMQRVVLLMNLNDEQTEKVVKRILDGFDRMCDRKDIEIRHDSADLSRSN